MRVVLTVDNRNVYMAVEGPRCGDSDRAPARFRVDRSQAYDYKVMAVRQSAPDERLKTCFSTKSLASQRRRLGLSAEDIGRLVGASSQSVYNWEAGKARPRNSQIPAIAALRILGRRTAVAHLAAMSSAQ